jgi:pyruvate,orthophosphate dikinase
LVVDALHKTIKVGGRLFKEGEVLTLNGTRGHVYAGALAMVDATENPRFQQFMRLADGFRALNVRTNADTPEDAARAREFGAEGIGLFRTEHMFYGRGSEQPLFLLRKMIVSSTEAERRAALSELYPFVKKDIKATLAVMDGLPVTIRLLDPPLHEFVPNNPEERAKLAQALGINAAELAKRADDLHESNPMMGHRGVRLGVTFPEISEMQIRAIFESAVELTREGKKVFPEIMVPVVGLVSELDDQKAIAKRIHGEVCAKYGVKRIEHMYGTMIEIPRAALTADKIAGTAEFFSYGTNDLTQMTFGFSRDDIGGFVPPYIEKKILPVDPFQVLDREGVGQLVDMGIKLGRATRPNLKVGICGEHGGEPNSVEFCHIVGMNYVSCSPFRVPIARLAAAQAQLTHPRGTKTGSGVRGQGSAKAKAKPKPKAKPRGRAQAKARTRAAAKGKARRRR